MSVMTQRQRTHRVVKTLEHTMRALGLWTEPAPPVPVFQMPFGMDAIPFEHWIQLVLVPRLRDVAQGKTKMPASSNLAAHAVREFDGNDDRWPLIDVLREVDALSPTSSGAIPASGSMASFSAIIAMANLGVVIAVVMAIHASQWASAAFSGFFPARVSHTYHASVSADEGHAPLRLSMMANVLKDGTLQQTDATLTLMGRGMKPGMPFKVTLPILLNLSGAPSADAVQAWLLQSGVDAASQRVMPAATEITSLYDVVVATRMRRELDGIDARLPQGLPAAQIVDIDAKTPQWIALSTGLLTALALSLPFLVFAIRTARRRRQARF